MKREVVEAVNHHLRREIARLEAVVGILVSWFFFLCILHLLSSIRPNDGAGGRGGDEPPPAAGKRTLEEARDT